MFERYTAGEWYKFDGLVKDCETELKETGKTWSKGGNVDHS